MKIKIRCLWLLTVFGCCSAFAAQITNITSTQSGNGASLYLTVQGPFTHRIFTLTNPNRVVIDLSGTHLAVNLKQLKLAPPLIKQARSGKDASGALRMVFEVSQRVGVASKPWYNGSQQGIRIDISAHSPLPVATPVQKAVTANANKKPVLVRSTPRSLVKSASSKTVPNKIIAKVSPPAHPHSSGVITSQPRITHNTPIQVTHSPAKSLRDVIVVLDAGHGGKDPGARGPRNSREKNVVLAIALKLKQLIDRQPGMHAVLTRSGDYYVGLRQRLDIARKYNGDIFVSIHADAFNNPHSSGASVFALSQGGATSEAARWIAEKENYSELGGVNLGDLDDTNGVVRSVLIDLSQTATINSSLQMGGEVLGQLTRFTRLHNHKVEQARFMVLKSPDTPSILVETGFISNPEEERNLTNSAYQSRLSQAIFTGIKGYFWGNPPHGTRIEAMASTRLHLVNKGETLPAIAARYRVSTQAVVAANHLSNRPSLKPGQKLVIPSAWA